MALFIFRSARDGFLQFSFVGKGTNNPSAKAIRAWRGLSSSPNYRMMNGVAGAGNESGSGSGH
jgi:hypothetical protein